MWYLKTIRASIPHLKRIAAVCISSGKRKASLVAFRSPTSHASKNLWLIWLTTHDEKNNVGPFIVFGRYNLVFSVITFSFRLEILDVFLAFVYPMWSCSRPGLLQITEPPVLAVERDICWREREPTAFPLFDFFVFTEELYNKFRWILKQFRVKQRGH